MIWSVLLCLLNISFVWYKGGSLYSLFDFVTHSANTGIMTRLLVSCIFKRACQLTMPLSCNRRVGGVYTCAQALVGYVLYQCTRINFCIKWFLSVSVIYIYMFISWSLLQNYQFVLYDRMERQRREEEVKTRSSKKGQEAEQSMMNRVWQVYLIIRL